MVLADADARLIGHDRNGREEKGLPDRSRPVGLQPTSGACYARPTLAIATATPLAELLQDDARRPLSRDRARRSLRDDAVTARRVRPARRYSRRRVQPAKPS